MVDTFRAHPSELSEVRRRVRELALGAGVEGARVDDIVLAVSEAAANAILHSGAEHITLTWRALGGRIEIDIEDTGIFRRRVPMPELRGIGGHGIPLMTALVDEIAIREGTARRPGTRVRLGITVRSTADAP